MYRKTLACLVVTLGLLAGSRAAFAQSLSPIAQTGIDRINAVADSYEDWVAEACPTFVQAIVDVSESTPALAQFYVNIYTGVVTSVANSHIRSINTIARTFTLLSPATSDPAIEAARVAAIARIELLEAECIAEIQAAVETPL